MYVFAFTPGVNHVPKTCINCANAISLQAGSPVGLLCPLRHPPRHVWGALLNLHCLHSPWKMVFPSPFPLPALFFLTSYVFFLSFYLFYLSLNQEFIEILFQRSSQDQIKNCMFYVCFTKEIKSRKNNISLSIYIFNSQPESASFLTRIISNGGRV